MINLATRLFTTLILVLLFTSNIYGNVISKDPYNTQQNNISSIENKVKTKQAILLKTQKSDTTKYMSLYDDVAELTISKNKLLLEMDRVDDIDTDKTCELAMNYGEVEFIKTQYYKTPFHDEVAKTLQNIATLYEQCHPPMAERYLKPILQIKEHIYGKESAEAANVHDKLGDHYRFSMAEFKNAIEHYEKAKNIREKLYGTKDPRVTENYSRLAMSIFYRGDKAKAEELAMKSLNIRKSYKKSSSMFIYRALIDTADFYDFTGSYNKSLKYLKEAEELLHNLKKENSPEMVEVYKSMSNVYLNLDDEKASQEYYQKASLIKY